jgi:hypothetical protein
MTAWNTEQGCMHCIYARPIDKAIWINREGAQKMKVKRNCRRKIKSKEGKIQRSANER